MNKSVDSKTTFSSQHNHCITKAQLHASILESDSICSLKVFKKLNKHNYTRPHKAFICRRTNLSEIVIEKFHMHLANNVFISSTFCSNTTCSCQWLSKFTKISSGMFWDNLVELIQLRSMNGKSFGKKVFHHYQR